MCGIAGIIGHQGSPDQIEKMTNALAHRGPDDSGIWTAPGVFLGHRRLSILDLSAAGHQPMVHGGLTIVYNGELYNFRQLRDQLTGSFQSESDTEVVLHLYAKYGERCVEYMRGMFAFAIWDGQRKRLFAARDRIGIKPFFYCQLERGFAFASELKALLQVASPAIDRTALSDFFTYKYVPPPKTIYEGMSKLAPAHTLIWDTQLHIQRYWHPESSEIISDPQGALEQYESLVHDAVSSHTLSDVPVGVFLSGGIDSTTVVANLNRPKTFTLGFDVKTHDETDAAREIAQAFNTEHHQEIAGWEDLNTALDTMVDVYDEPFGDHSGWPVFLISRSARESVTVALSGEGGDELFAGYDWYDKFTKWRSIPFNRSLARLLPPFWRGARSYQRHSAIGLERYAMLQGLFTPRQKTALFSPDLQFDEYDDLWFYRQHWRPELSPIKRLQWIDMHTYLPEDILTKVDRASMKVSLEVRPPLLDHPLVEFALAMHPKLMRDTQRGKLIMRHSLKSRVPPGTLDRRQSGFTSPVRRWSKRQPNLLGDALKRLSTAGIIQDFRLGRLTNEQIWSLLFLDRWIERNRISF